MKVGEGGGTCGVGGPVAGRARESCRSVNFLGRGGSPTSGEG